MIKIIEILKKINRKYPNLKKILLRVFNNNLMYLIKKNNTPISNVYGLDRGIPIDRYYIEKFLEENKIYINGKCLEVLNNQYTIKYGENIIISDIIDIDKNNKKATIYGDLRKMEMIKNDYYDCIILTQVFQFIDDLDSAIKECHRILKPGGTILATMPSVSRIDCVSGVDGDYWRFTKSSIKYLFEKIFKEKELKIETVGNVKICSNFLIGISQEEISKKQLNYNDINFPLLVTLRATKNKI